MGLERGGAAVFVAEAEGGVGLAESESGVVFGFAEHDEVADGIVSWCAPGGEAVVDKGGADALVLEIGADGDGGEAEALGWGGDGLGSLRVDEGDGAVGDVGDDLVILLGDEAEGEMIVESELVDDLTFGGIFEGRIMDVADGGDVGRLFAADDDLGEIVHEICTYFCKWIHEVCIGNDTMLGVDLPVCRGFIVWFVCS